MNMRVVLGVLALSAAILPQAEAGAYVEGRVGIAGDAYDTTETVGAAVGFEVTGGSGGFFGAEFVVDAFDGLTSSAAGINLRAGTSVNENSRIFVTLGRVWQRVNYTYFDGVFLTTVDDYVYDTVAGIGYQADISSNAYVSVQYQRLFDLEANRGMVGIGLKF